MAAPQQQMVVNDPMIMAAQANVRNPQTSVYVFQGLYQAPQNPTGWQSQVSTNDRHGKTMTLVSNIMLALQGHDWKKIADYALQFEKKLYTEATSKLQYDQEFANKTLEMMKKRQAQAPGLQNQIQADAARQAQLQQQQQQQQQQMMIMNQMAARGMTHPAQAFQNMQRPMQQVPQPSQPFAMGMANPAMLQSQPNQPQFSMQMGQAQQQIPNAAAARLLSPADAAQVREMGQKMYMQATEQQRQNIRLNLAQHLSQQQIADCQAAGKDPVLQVFQNQMAQKKIRFNAQMAMSRQQGMPPVPQPHNAGQMVNPAGDLAHFPQTMGGQQIGQPGIPPGAGLGRDPTQQGPMMGFPQQGTPGNPQAPGQMQRGQMPFNGQMDPATLARVQAAQAQARAQQQSNRLQQAGVLAGPPTTSQGSSMNTLNAPMQQPPVAMGPANGQAMNQGNPQTAAVNTLNPNFNHNTNTRPQMMTPQMQAMINNLGADKLNGVSDNKMRELLARWQAEQRLNGQQQQQQPPQQAQMPGMQAANINGPNQFGPANPKGQQPQQPGVGMPPSSQPGMMNPALRAAQMMNQAAQLQLNSPHAKAIMETMDIPANIMQQLGNRMPPGITKWGQLKQWQSNVQGQPQAIPQATMGQLVNMQLRQYQAIVNASRNNAAALNNLRQPQPQPQQLQGPPHLQQPPAPQQTQAPAQQQPPQQVQPQVNQQVQQQPAQRQAQEQAQQQAQQPQKMQQPQPQPQPQQQPTPQQQPSQGPAQTAGQPQDGAAGKLGNQFPPLPAHVKIPPRALEVTDQEVQKLMENPRFKTIPPHMLPKLARKLKEDAFIRAYWASQQQKLNATPPTPTVAGPQAAHQVQAGPVNLKNPQQANNTVQAPTAVKSAQNANPSPAQPAKNNLKRPSTDDLADGGQNSNFEQNQRVQNAGNSDKMQAQQAQMEAAMRNRPEVERLQAIGREEHLQAQRQFASNSERVIPMTPQELAEVRRKLLDVAARFNLVSRAVSRWWQVTRNEDRARQFFRTRFQLGRQFKDEKLTQPKDVFSISSGDLDQISAFSDSFKMEMAAVFKAQAPNQVPQPAPQPAPEGPAPLNAANLEKQAQILKQQQNRAVNKAAQPPPPPTTTQPPFGFGPKQPPAGGPTYLNKPQITTDNLHLPPPRKKTKTNAQQTSSPATQQAAAPSPQVKPPSPDLKRQPPPEPVKPETKTYPCPEFDCEYQTVGFFTEDALQAHIQEEHVRPNEDPFRFVNDHLASALGLDQQGNDVKVMPNASGQDSLAAPPMNASLSKQGQTPISKPDFAATPMSRDASMRRQGSSAGTPGRVGIKSENTPKLADSKLPGARQESETPQMTMADDPWANSTIDPQNLFATFAPLETLPGSLASDLAMYRSLTPNDTPESSKDSGASEPNSDISEGMNLDIDLAWQSMEGGDIMKHMASFHMDGFEPLDADIMGEDNFQFQSFDDMNDFSKPFQFDSSLYSMDPS